MVESLAVSDIAGLENKVYTLDLNFMGVPHAIASYLIPHKNGALLIESGPGSTQEALKVELGRLGYAITDVTDVLLTHIHLDHAGAAGWLAHQGARIYVHPVGAPHLLNPEKLLASAARIYGEMMETLWGQFLPVPESQLSILEDGEIVEVGDLRFRAINTPGHAEHHYSYRHGDLVFTGDIGGVRLPGLRHIRLPMPPPEFNLEKWRSSLKRLEAEGAAQFAPTHFGVFGDTSWHLAALQRALDEVEAWMEQTLPQNPPVEDLNRDFIEWSEQRSRSEGLDGDQIDAYETANPSWMSAQGIQRYWRKVRAAEGS